ncbi:uncharacterized protein LOC119117275 isoform X2 [Syngnathus acus]|uniref:uncharacterized protein LOC119117275 isoform X2 n=1 Tax=Syngnathus acus TaxID=161584 RepID=UPI001885BF95|nr:uncharacterized protein LOC119117275 isoform X2 [Syngnathus acus]
MTGDHLVAPVCQAPLDDQEKKIWIDGCDVRSLGKFKTGVLKGSYQMQVPPSAWRAASQDCRTLVTRQRHVHRDGGPGGFSLSRECLRIAGAADRTSACTERDRTGPRDQRLREAEDECKRRVPAGRGPEPSAGRPTFARDERPTTDGRTGADAARAKCPASI